MSGGDCFHVGHLKVGFFRLSLPQDAWTFPRRINQSRFKNILTLLLERYGCLSSQPWLLTRVFIPGVTHSGVHSSFRKVGVLLVNSPNPLHICVYKPETLLWAGLVLFLPVGLLCHCDENVYQWSQYPKQHTLTHLSLRTPGALLSTVTPRVLFNRVWTKTCFRGKSASDMGWEPSSTFGLCSFYYQPEKRTLTWMLWAPLSLTLCPLQVLEWGILEKSSIS